VGFARTLRIENQDAVVLNGTHFSDVIVGNGNVNQINGGEGHDVILGGIRGDFLTGGEGMDRFGYSSLFDSHGIRHDTILDLSDLEDTIDVSGVDADDFAAGNQAFTQVVAHTAGNVGELEVEYHVGGRFAGQTTIKCWTNTDDKVDLLIAVVGDHSGFTGFDL
jgi:Ca2+-binding RTX toxin-like protein